MVGYALPFTCVVPLQSGGPSGAGSPQSHDESPGAQVRGLGRSKVHAYCKSTCALERSVFQSPGTPRGAVDGAATRSSRRRKSWRIFKSVASTPS